jgi:hypothetical protein
MTVGLALHGVMDADREGRWCGLWAAWRSTAQVRVTTHELPQLLGMSFRTDAAIDQVEPGRRLQWRAHDRQKQLEGSRLVEPTGPASCRFTEVVEGPWSAPCGHWSQWFPGCSSGRPQPTYDG